MVFSQNPCKRSIFNHNRTSIQIQSLLLTLHLSIHPHGDEDTYTDADTSGNH